MRRLTKHVGEAGIGSLDIALWDLAGKCCGLSIAQMLGGHRWQLPAYASTIHGDEQQGGLSQPEAYADFAESCLDLGYSRLQDAWVESGRSEKRVEDDSSCSRTCWWKNGSDV